MFILFSGLGSCGKDSSSVPEDPETTEAPQVPEEEGTAPVPRNTSRTYKCYFAESEGQYGLKSLIKKSQTALTYSECGDTTGVCRSSVALAYQNTDSQKCVTQQEHPEDFQICLSPDAPIKTTPQGRLIQGEFAELDTVTELWCEEGIRSLF